MNVTVSIALVDPESFGSSSSVRPVVDAAAAELFPVYIAFRGGMLDNALARPANRESLEGAELAALGVERR